MLIEIDPAAACHPDAHRWLDRLLHSIEDNWHAWDVSGLEDFGSTSWVTSRGRRGEEVMSLFVAAVMRSAWASGPHSRRMRVTLEPCADGDVTPEQGVRFAEKHLVILVENRDSDGVFLRRVIAEMDPVLNKWICLDPSPLHIDDRGGKGQMRLEVKKRRDQRPRPRFMVVVDSDCKAPGDRPSVEVSRLEGKCRDLGFPCWVLAKRESENYLTRELLELRPNAGGDHRLRTEAWDRMTDDQKDFYDMKNGLPTSPGEAEEALYESIHGADREVLQQGFGEAVCACWNQYRDRGRHEWEERGRKDLERGLALIRQEV